MTTVNDRLTRNLKKVTSEDRLHVFYPWLNTDEKRNIIIGCIENGTIENEQQLVVKILDEFRQR